MKLLPFYKTLYPSLYLSLLRRVGTSRRPPVRLLEDLHHVLFGTNNYRNGRFRICTLGRNRRCILQRARASDDRETAAYSYSDKYS